MVEKCYIGYEVPGGTVFCPSEKFSWKNFSPEEIQEMELIGEVEYSLMQEFLNEIQ